MNLCIARSFASALDEDDFVAAAACVHSACVYESPGGRVVGREAILDSYRENAEWARATFDRLEFESLVESLGDGRVRVTYTDRMWPRPRTQNPAAELSHVYECRQVLRFNEDGLITSIEHVEIPGQREALERFFDACGITRRA